jgi:hypothetical protein
MEQTEVFLFWKGMLIRAFVTFGFIFFSTLITFRDIVPVLQSSFIGAGLYFFTEMMKYYKLQPDKKIVEKKINTYKYLV